MLNQLYHLYFVPPDIVPLFSMSTIKPQPKDKSDIRLYKMGFLVICVNMVGQSQSLIGSGWAWHCEAAKYDKYSERSRPIIARRHLIQPIRDDSVIHGEKNRSKEGFSLGLEKLSMAIQGRLGFESPKFHSFN